MKKPLRNKVLGVLLSAALLLSLTAAGLQSLIALADNDATDLLAAAAAYVDQAGNAVTREGLLAAVSAAEPTAELAEEDIFIRHAVNGCYDEDTQYPLNIPGSDGAVAAVFTVGGSRISFTRGIPHTMELIETTRTVVASRETGEFDFADGGNPWPAEQKMITNFKGEGENLKLVLPDDDYDLGPVFDMTNADKFTVVIIDHGRGMPVGDNDIYNNNRPYSFRAFTNLKAVQYNAQTPAWYFSEWKGGTQWADNERFNATAQFAGLKKLRYVKCPAAVYVANNASPYLGFNTFSGCEALETIVLPAMQEAWPGAGNTEMGYHCLYGTAVQDIYLPAGASYNSYYEPLGAGTYTGTRSVIAYGDPMTLLRAAALAQAKLSELDREGGYTNEEKLAAAKAAVTGSADAAAFAETLTFAVVSGSEVSLTDGKTTLMLTADMIFDDGPVDEDAVRAAADEYIRTAGNKATKEGLLAAVRKAAKAATVAEEDIFIKHAVNGCYDEDAKYPLYIPGSDGAAVAIFDVKGTRIPFAAVIPHTMELIETTRTVVASRTSGEFDFADGGNPGWVGEQKTITNFRGEGDNLKLVLPDDDYDLGPSYAMQNADKFTVVVIDHGRGMPVSDNDVYNGNQPYSFRAFTNLKAVQYNAGDPNWYFSEWNGGGQGGTWEKSDDPEKFNATAQFEGLKKLKYVKCPAAMYVADNASPYLGFKTFNGCAALETIVLPELKPVNNGGNTALGYLTLYGTAVRDVFLPEKASYNDYYQSLADATFDGGFRNIIDYTQDMTFARAVALAIAAANDAAENETLTDAEALAAVKAAVCGAHDAAAFADGLTFTRVADAENKLRISDGRDSFDIDFVWAPALLSLSVKGQELTPAFDRNTLAYTLTVEHETDSVEIEATPQPGCTVESGLGVHKLNVGPNTLSVTVRGGKKVAVYTVSVARKASETLDLQGMADRIAKEGAKLTITPFGNGTTEESLTKALRELLLGYGDVQLDLLDYYKLEPIEGATEDGAVLVPGYNGYLRAVVNLTVDGVTSVQVPLSYTIKAPMKNYSFAPDEISRPEDFELSKKGDRVRSYNGSAKKIIIPDGVKEIDWEWNNSAHPENAVVLVIPDSVEILPEYLCIRMRNLEAVRMGDKIVELPAAAFDTNIFLRYVRLSESLQSIGASAFANTPSLGTLHLPDSVTTIGANAFNYSMWRYVDLSKNVTLVANGAFANPPVKIGSDQWYTDLDDERRQQDMERLKPVWADFIRVEKLTEYDDPMEDFDSTRRVTTILNKNTVFEHNDCFAVSDASSQTARHTIRAAEDAAVCNILNFDHPKDLKYYRQFERLDMSLCEAAARAQRAADILPITEKTTAGQVLTGMQDSYVSSDIGAPAWTEPYKVSGGRASGTAVLSAGGDLTFTVTVARTLSASEEPSSDPDSAPESEPESVPSSAADPESEPGGNPDTGAAACGAPAALLAAAAAAVVITRKKKHA